MSEPSCSGHAESGRSDSCPWRQQTCSLRSPLACRPGSCYPLQRHGHSSLFSRCCSSTLLATRSVRFSAWRWLTAFWDSLSLRERGSCCVPRKCQPWKRYCERGRSLFFLGSSKCSQHPKCSSLGRFGWAMVAENDQQESLIVFN